MEQSESAVSGLNERLLAVEGGTPPTVDKAEIALVEQLPDLLGRIQRLGLLEEYSAFKNSYSAWRKGKARGAKGEVTHDHISRPEHVAANRATGFKVPTLQEWLWRRTISYWICVTFFEGAIFFAISCFLSNYEEELGHVYLPITSFGVIAGKVNFFIGCYFMCLEVINMEVDEEEEHVFYFWPFRYRIALDKLTQAGSDCCPYVCGSTYLIGVLVFWVGLLTEYTPLPPEVAGPIHDWLFEAGAVWFVIGGCAECLQNKIFTAAWTQGTVSAFLNLAGGALFLFGSTKALMGDMWTNNASYGWGAVSFAAAASIQLNMWKDEQFGLTFLTGINAQQHPNGVNVLVGGDTEGNKGSAFSFWGFLMVHIFCWLGAMSTYNVLIEMARFFDKGTFRDFQYAFNEMLPCLFSHIMLAVFSAVLRTPKFSPFRQLFKLTRILGVVLTVNSTVTFYQFVTHQITQ